MQAKSKTAERFCLLARMTEDLLRDPGTFTECTMAFEEVCHYLSGSFISATISLCSAISLDSPFSARFSSVTPTRRAGPG